MVENKYHKQVSEICQDAMEDIPHLEQTVKTDGMIVFRYINEERQAYGNGDHHLMVESIVGTMMENPNIAAIIIDAANTYADLPQHNIAAKVDPKNVN